MTWIAALGFVKRFWWAIPLLGVAIALMITRGTLERRTAALEAEKQAHLGTIANYRAAAHEAARNDAENVLRVKGEQAKITETVTNDYQADLASLRARYDRLRAKASTDSRRAAATGMSRVPNATSGTDVAPGSDELLAKLMAAEENTLKLVSLQDWVRGQTAVDVGNLTESR